MAELSFEYAPAGADSFQGQYTRHMAECQSGADIITALKRIECEMDTLPDTKQYINAIRRAVALREYKTCFEIFAVAKELQVIDLSLFGTMIWVCAQQRSVRSLNTGLALFVEMQEVYSLRPSISIYNQLLALCINTLSYPQGKQLWHKLRQHQTISPDLSTYNLAMDLHCKAGEMHVAVAIFEKLLQGKLGDLRPNYVIFRSQFTWI